jgi:hypothetical protein
MAAATNPIITKRVGDSGNAGHKETLRIQQLLMRAGFLSKAHLTGSWGKTAGASAKAWHEYQVSKGWQPRPYLDPMDAEDRLAQLASDAGVIMWVPHFLKSLSAASVLVDFCITSAIPYGWASHGDGTRMVWGFENRPWAVVFTEGGTFDVEAKEARSLNCCSFVNLLLSVWLQGNAHSKPYDASQAVGGDGAQLGPRYSMPELKTKKGERVFDSLDELQSTLQPDRIYHMALCKEKSGTFTKHDVAVINGKVYQANVKSASPNAGAVYVKPLEDQWKAMSVKRVRVYGPGPF